MKKIFVALVVALIVAACAGGPGAIATKHYTENGEPRVRVTVSGIGISEQFARKAYQRAQSECSKYVQKTMDSGTLSRPLYVDAIAELIVDLLKAEGEWDGPCILTQQ